MKGKYRLLLKVRLADVVQAPDRNQHDRRWHAKIKGYHVDFLVCDPKTTRPLLVVELDDASHQAKEQTERDAFKDRVLEAAGIPILRVRASPAYDQTELTENVEKLIRQARQ